MSRRVRALLARREFALIAVIIVLGAIVTSISPQFLTVGNLVNIATGNVVLAVLAIGMALVLITAHIDVSVGAQLAVVSVVVGRITLDFSESGLIANPFSLALLALLIGALLGAVNGILVAVVGLPAIIVTLGTASIARGGLLFVTNGQWVSGLPPWLTELQTSGPAGIPWVLVILAVVAVACWLLVNRTRFGRDILAAGGNREAAARFGVRIVRVDMTVFVVMGALSGLAGFLYLVRMGSAQPGAGVGIELNAIAAAVLGGASVFGGRFHLGGTLLGVLLLGVIENMLVLSRIPVYWQTLVSGVIVVLAVTATVVQERSVARRRAAAQGPARRIESVEEVVA